METQDEQVSGPLAAEVVAALRDLARIAEHAGSTDSDSPGSVASMLLERLLVLCAAQRGVLFLMAHDQHASAEDFLPSPSSSGALRTLALHGISEEEGRSLLNVFALAEEQSELVLREACWIVYRLPIVAPLVHQHGAFKADRSTGEQSASHREQPLQVVLLLGWGGLKNGGSASVVERARARLSPAADAVGAVLVTILLTERLHEFETAAERRSLQEMELLKAELLATVSHELRSPLASIKGYAATLLRHERRISREERHEFLLAISAASDRLELIIDRLLELSQFETDAIRIKPSPVDVARLAREALTIVEQRVSGPSPGRFTFNLRLKDAAGGLTRDAPIIMADPRRLREVLDNLLENAVNYSPEGGAIDVIVHPVASLFPGEKAPEQVSETPASDEDAHLRNTRPVAQKPGRVLEICVCDNGLGIPTEHLERIFDRFHRVDTRLTREINGLGLGLTICKRIIELHHGTIWAQSCPSGGSALHVRLPVDEEEKNLAPLAGARVNATKGS
jgi:signal transduction histidine kinase